ncbi:MAG: TIGR03960 family B12-binding radical SAM protein [Deltaproteobacteria bacterium]|nr:TIGR03960 family B12-binding radical SAM protein [Deltaproteobacteria bacterium]
MSIWDETWFSALRRPGRYIGEEVHSIRKDLSKVEISIALAFPDVYEVGMSHLGLKILYGILNSHEWIAAERVFSPWVDLERALRSRRLPMRAIESERPLGAFDILGFSLQHELTFTNILTILELSGIPFLSEERGPSHPLVIAGGPACFNPEPVAPLFDAILIGDGEVAAVEICQVVRDRKRRGRPRKGDILHDLADLDGVYVPGFFKVEYASNGTPERLEPMRPGHEKVRKAILPDLNRSPLPVSQVVPYVELVHDRLSLEVCRGCTRGCRFCQAGMIYRPVRERSPQSVMESAEDSLRLTGYDELSLLSLSTGDYSCISPLLRALMDRFSAQKVAVSLPSLRVDSLDRLWFEELKRVRKTGFTLAAEAGNDRLRRVINKGLTNQEILDMAREVYGAGWNLIKLYFMIGLPQEQEEDIQDIVALAREVAGICRSRGKRPKLNVSIATFVPKSHTPFMWAPQITLEESLRRIQKVRNALAHSRIHVKWNLPEMSWLEGVFSRGDRRLAPVLVEAWQRGARFDAWSEHFKVDIWRDSFRGRGPDPRFYLHRERSPEEAFPWDHIDCGVTRDFLRREWEKSLEGRPTADCREGCLECGVCDHREIRPVLHREWVSPPASVTALPDPHSSGERRYRIRFSKLGKARHLSHLEVVRLFSRAFRRGGLKMVYSKGYHPMPRISFYSALPVGVESLDESLEIRLHETLSPPKILERLNAQLPPGIRITTVADVTEDQGKSAIRATHYQVRWDGAPPQEGNLKKFQESESFPVVRISRDGEKQVIDARSIVLSISFSGSHEVNLVLGRGAGPEPRPADIVREVFHLGEEEMKGVRVLKTKQVL